MRRFCSSKAKCANLHSSVCDKHRVRDQSNSQKCPTLKSCLETILLIIDCDCQQRYVLREQKMRSPWNTPPTHWHDVQPLTIPPAPSFEIWTSLADTTSLLKCIEMPSQRSCVAFPWQMRNQRTFVLPTAASTSRAKLLPWPSNNNGRWVI